MHPEKSTQRMIERAPIPCDVGPPRAYVPSQAEPTHGQKARTTDAVSRKLARQNLELVDYASWSRHGSHLTIGFVTTQERLMR